MQYILSLLTFILSVAGYAQKSEDISLKHSMKQDGLSLQFTVLDPDRKGVKNYDTHKTYCWYKAQKVIGTQGGSSGMLLHGLYESFYTNKQLCEKGHYAKGLKNGEWLYWRTDGTLIRTEHWNNGTQRGEQLDFSANGELQKRTVIRGRHTTMKSGDTLVEVSGTSKTITTMDSTGRVLTVARYRDNLLHGKQESYASDGSKTVISYKKGVPVATKAKKEKQSETTAAPSADKPEKQTFRTRVKSRFRKKERTNADPAAKPARKNKKEQAAEVKPEQSQNETPGTPKKQWNPFKRKAA